MAKNSITDYDNISGNNTDVQSVDISEGCSPSGINNAIREVMADLADVNDGTVALTSPQVNSLTLNGNANFGDNDKAIFGAGNDLQIYHDGSHSRIDDTGTGNLVIRATNLTVQSATNENYIRAEAEGDVKLYYNNAQKLATTATGVDVTGSVTIDNGSSAGTVYFVDTTNYINLSGGSMQFANGGTERMRIDSSGNVYVGADGSTYNTAFLRLYGRGSSSTSQRIDMGKTFSGNVVGVGFYHAGSSVGSIDYSNTGVAYNTSSDYRLKENVTDITGATERLKQLNPVRFNFIADADTTVDGFLAHEVQDVVPEAITGTKDAVDNDGNPVYQGIDQSKLVPLLVATIQELEARIAALEAN